MHGLAAMTAFNRKSLEADKDIQIALSWWGANSIAGFAAIVLERAYRADASGDAETATELKRHIDYFSEKANTDLGLILHGDDFEVEKAVFVDFAHNALSASKLLTSVWGPDSRASDLYENINNALVRIQTQLALNSWVVNKSPEQLRKRILELGSLLSPMTANGVGKIRVGGPSDGGYVMLDDFERVSGALSFGVNDNDTWDCDIVGRVIDVHQYDHAIDRPPSSGKGLTFFKEMVVPNGSTEGTTLAAAVARQRQGPLLLKCDIEGSEWEIFANATQATLGRFAQIVCEFHGFGSIADDTCYSTMHTALDKLSNSFAVVHLHANNSGPWMIVAGVPFPSVLEVTYANKQMYSTRDSVETLPTEHDAPNAPHLPEHYLGNFKYQKA
jgi:hypothetical protein